MTRTSIGTCGAATAPKEERFRLPPVEPGDMAVLGSILLFGGIVSGADAELMRSDGTAAGTKLVKRTRACRQLLR